MNAVWGFEAAGLLVFLFAGGPRALLRLPRAALWIALVWCTVGLLALADISIGNRLYLSTSIYDHYLRVAITDAITRTGIPPLNPQYFLGSGAPLRYHYFWFALCSLVDRLGPGPRDAFTASCIWAGLALISLTALFVRHRNLKRAGLAVALLAVTGLDIVPVLLRLLHAPHHIDPDMEWWNETVYSWIGAVTWAPHYIAALVAGFTGVLLLWYAATAPRRSRFIHAVAAGFAFASCVGLNFYVAITFAASLAVWLTIAALRRWNNHALPLLIAGVTAIIIVVPYLTSLNPETASGAPLLSMAVRDFFPLHRLAGAHPAASLRFASLPFNYLLELGFFALILVWRTVRPSSSSLKDCEIALIVFTVVPLLLASFFRSGQTANNDFGNTAPLLAQFVLVLWGADFLAVRSRLPTAWRVTAQTLLVIGLASSSFELLIDRIYFPLADAGVVPPVIVNDHRMAERAYAMRSLYQQLERKTPQTAVFQTNPSRALDDIFFGLYAHRQMAAASMNCGTGFGGNTKTCLAVIQPLAAAFNSDPPGRIPDSLGIDVVVITDSDSAFHHVPPLDQMHSTGQSSSFARVTFLNKGY